MRALLDSDVIIDLLCGRIPANEEAARYSWLGLARITWMEVLVGARNDDDRERVEAFLRQFPIVELDESIARDVITLRQQHRLKLPDAIIWASARVHDALLVSRNRKDFPARDPGIRIPYQL